MDQAVRQVPADAVAALHRPDPVCEHTGSSEHLRIAGLVRAIPARCRYYRPLVDDLDRGRALMRGLTKAMEGVGGSAPSWAAATSLGVGCEPK